MPNMYGQRAFFPLEQKIEETKLWRQNSRKIFFFSISVYHTLDMLTEPQIGDKSQERIASYTQYCSPWSRQIVPCSTLDKYG